MTSSFPAPRKMWGTERDKAQWHHSLLLLYNYANYWLIDNIISSKITQKKKKLAQWSQNQTTTYVHRTKQQQQPAHHFSFLIPKRHAKPPHSLNHAYTFSQTEITVCTWQQTKPTDPKKQKTITEWRKFFFSYQKNNRSQCHGMPTFPH